MTAAMLHLRDAASDDDRLLFAWANDPVIRASSLSPDPIRWEDHMAWFHAKLKSPNSCIFIAEDDDGTPVGQIRFDRMSEGVFEVDVHVSTVHRGAGFGVAIIQAGIARLFSTKAVRAVHAHILKDNTASLRAFSKAGFVHHGQKIIKGHRCCELIARPSSVG